MRPAAGLAVNLYAAEPDVRQPILVKFDDRGRLWTIQYLQYPTPAGLKRVKVDRWSARSIPGSPNRHRRDPEGTIGSPSARIPMGTAAPTASKTS